MTLFCSICIFSIYFFNCLYGHVLVNNSHSQPLMEIKTQIKREPAAEWAISIIKKKNSNNWMSQQVSLARKVREVALKIDETFTKAQYMAVAGSTRWAFGHSEHVEPIERAPIIMTIPNDLSRFAAFELRGFSSVPQLSEKCCEAPRNFYIAPDFNPN